MRTLAHQPALIHDENASACRMDATRWKQSEPPGLGIRFLKRSAAGRRFDSPARWCCHPAPTAADGRLKPARCINAAADRRNNFYRPVPALYLTPAPSLPQKFWPERVPAPATAAHPRRFHYPSADSHGSFRKTARLSAVRSGSASANPLMNTPEAVFRQKPDDARGGID